MILGNTNQKARRGSLGGPLGGCLLNETDMLDGVGGVILYSHQRGAYTFRGATARGGGTTTGVLQHQRGGGDYRGATVDVAYRGV